MPPRAPPRRRPAPAAGGPGFGDSARVLLALAALYAAMSLLAYRVIHMRHVAPLGADAPRGNFSEGRVLQHLRRLAVDIPGRQEGSPGLEAAAQYIKGELQGLAARAGPEYRIEVEETLVSGSFSMMFLRHRVTLGYRNHKNIVMRVSSNVSEDDDPSLLVNGHFDSPLGSPGAADCGSCVGICKSCVDLFLCMLFNQGSHGFIKTHRWNRTIRAFINIEASGSGGTDLVCQSGPGSWPSRVYAQTAKYPMANSVAQVLASYLVYSTSLPIIDPKYLKDMFGIIPGDTDYRIFAEDITNIPGLDIIFVLGGYFYHTSYDTLENLLPGSIQARGENLFNLVKAFTNPMLLKENEISNKAAKDGIEDVGAVFFDYLTWFMVFYSRDISLILHSLPIAIFLLVPLFLKFPNITLMSWFVTLLGFMRGMVLHTFGVILAIFIPALAAALRLLFTKNAMNWFAHPYLAFLMFVPTSLIGLLLPRLTWVYTLAGLSGGFLTFFISMSMLLGRFVSRIIRKQWSQQSPRSLVAYVLPMTPCLLYGLYYGGFLIQFLIEKMGMMGSLPKPYGYFVPDVIVGAVVGLVVGWCFGPLSPVASRWLSKTSIIHGFLQITVVALAISSQLFPYSTGAPKRVVLQHTFVTGLLLALYPVPFLFSGSLKFQAQTEEIKKYYQHFPQLAVQEIWDNNGQRRVHLKLALGSLSEIWTSVLNITGPLSNWSFADNMLPAPQTVSGGPPSYICRLSGKSDVDWSFWLEANSSESLRVDVAVLDQYLVDSTKKLKSLFPSWADLTAFTTFFSTYHL
ncbi:Zn-dependent exopeptidase superfamily protein [Zea mays]|uniref:Zn-dependent exopeptidase superfamily protein n=1 Tax=Zea mays TaxID=4577 RepID=A0A1D6HXE7_MAIZE|nr:Zn-dependent exopeptidase superfamily protein [Zea mays]